MTSGPYRWVRHPMYIGGTLLFSSFVLLTASWLIALCVVIALSMLMMRSRLEEQRLIDKFGDAYRDYQNQTPRFLPRLTLKRSWTTTEVKKGT